MHWHDIDFTSNKINFRNARRRVLATGATEVDGKVEFDYVNNAVDQGLKNGDAIKVLDISEQPELRKLLLERKLRSSTDLVFLMLMAAENHGLMHCAAQASKVLDSMICVTLVPAICFKADGSWTRLAFT